MVPTQPTVGRRRVACLAAASLACFVSATAGAQSTSSARVDALVRDAMRRFAERTQAAQAPAPGAPPAASPAVPL